MANFELPKPPDLRDKVESPLIHALNALVPRDKHRKVVLTSLAERTHTQRPD
jgi:hypothetical protein